MPSVDGLQFDGIDAEEDGIEPSANEREERNADLPLPSIGDALIVIVAEILRPIPIPQHLPSKRRGNERCKRIRKEDFGTR